MPRVEDKDQNALNFSPKTILQMGQILEALAHEDALAIFMYARNGISNSTEAIKKLGLTQKRYYSRLKPLLDTRMLERGDLGYQYTLLGETLSKMTTSFSGVLEKSDKMELAGRVRKSKALSQEEKERLMDLITGSESKELKLPGEPESISVLTDYEEHIGRLVDLVERSTVSVTILTKLGDIRVIEAIVKALQRGITVRMVRDDKAIPDRLTAMRLLLSPKTMSFLTSTAKELSGSVRRAKTDTGYLVVDDKHVVVEVPHPAGDPFFMSFCFESEDVAQSMSEVFQKVWDEADQSGIL